MQAFVAACAFSLLNWQRTLILVSASTNEPNLRST